MVRISGTRVPQALHALGVETLPAPRTASVRRLKDADGDVLDEALVLYFPAPHSFTGEDVAELHLHGSRAVVQATLSLLASVPGLRLAEAGEFTRQAFLNGKMDLTAAEGIADIIHAETDAQRKQALRQLSGHTARQLEDWRAALLHEMAMIEAFVDFPEEDIPADILRETEQHMQQLSQSIHAALHDNHIGERIRNGLSIAIVGAPNVGKSTLLNLLAKRDVAIVADWPGTTRDVVESHLTIAGYPVVVADTAGIRATQDPIEAEGIRRAHRRAEDADILLLLRDATRPDAFPPLPDSTSPMPRLYLTTKIDLAAKASPPLPFTPAEDNAHYACSLTTGEGLDSFVQALEATVRQCMTQHTPPLVTQQRHRLLLQQAAEALETFSLTHKPLELAAEDLRLAATALGRLTGRIAVDDILDKVFSSFCIGK